MNGTCLCGNEKHEHSYMGCHAPECDCVYYSPGPPRLFQMANPESFSDTVRRDPDAHLGAVEE